LWTDLLGHLRRTREQLPTPKQPTYSQVASWMNGHEVLPEAEGARAVRDAALDDADYDYEAAAPRQNL
jgi:hypothetical protein